MGTSTSALMHFQNSIVYYWPVNCIEKAEADGTNSPCFSPGVIPTLHFRFFSCRKGGEKTYFAFMRDQNRFLNKVLWLS